MFRKLFRSSELLLKKQWAMSMLFLAGGLRAGLTIEQCLKLLKEHMPDPLGRYLDQTEMSGHDIFPISRRIESLMKGPDLALSRGALLLAQRAGGQAASVLEQCAKVLQSKIEMEEKLRALTAQNRISSWIIGLTPIGLLSLFSIVAPDYIAPLFQEPWGWGALILGSLLILIGLIFVRRWSRIE